MEYKEQKIQERINELINISPDFLNTDEEISVWNTYKNKSLSDLTDKDIKLITDYLSIPCNRQLRYAQEEFYNAFAEILETYKNLDSKIDMLTTTVATITYEMRFSLGGGVHSPNRSKGYNSFLQNINKEFTKALKKIDSSCSKENIKTIIMESISNICKDLYGATIIFHMANNMKQYCEESNDPQCSLLYQQLIGIDNYLLQSEKISNSSSLSEQKKSKIKISDIFIDGKHSCNSNHISATPFNLKRINTLEDYYNLKISLLTLLSNVSMFEMNSELGQSNSKRIVSETDMSCEDLIHLIELEDSTPKSNLEYMKKFTELAQKYYFEPHIPFDKQLKETLSNQKKDSHKDNYKKPLSETQKEKLKLELRHLRDNLNSLKADRLYNYILQTEVETMIQKLNDIGFNVDIVSTKKVAKPNGFVAIYYIIQVNGLFEFELQAYDEFRANLSKEGNAAHNSNLPGKLFDITDFFELENPISLNEQSNIEYLKNICNFLNCIKYNSIKSSHLISKTNQLYKRILIDLVDYARNQLKIKDSFEVENNSYYPYQNEFSNFNEQYKDNISKFKNKPIKFKEYIDELIYYYCAKFGDIQANHSEGDHNTIMIKNKSSKDALLSFFKNRIGLSALAYMIIDKYTELSPESTTGEYHTIASEKEAQRLMQSSTQVAKKSIHESVDSNNDAETSIPLYFPQGQYNNIDNTER